MVSYPSANGEGKVEIKEYKNSQSFFFFFFDKQNEKNILKASEKWRTKIHLTYKRGANKQAKRKRKNKKQPSSPHLEPNQSTKSIMVKE